MKTLLSKLGASVILTGLYLVILGMVLESTSKVFGISYLVVSAIAMGFGIASIWREWK